MVKSARKNRTAQETHRCQRPNRSVEVTNLLHAWNRGDQQALQKLMDIVYEDLHRAAHRYMAAERWKLAKVWFLREMKRGNRDGS